MPYCKEIKSWVFDHTFADKCPKVSRGEITLTGKQVTVWGGKFDHWWQYCDFGQCPKVSEHCEICLYPKAIPGRKVQQVGKYYLCDECISVFDDGMIMDLKTNEDLRITSYSGKRSKKKWFEESHTLTVDAVVFYKVITPSYRIDDDFDSKYTTVFVYEGW